MGKVLQVSEETYQQLADLAQHQQRPLEEMLRLCLLAYEQYQYHLVHQQMVAEGLLETLPPPLADRRAGGGRGFRARRHSRETALRDELEDRR